MVEAGGAPLEHRGDDHNFQFARQRAERVAGWAGHGFGLIETLRVLGLAKVHAGVQFLQQHELRAARVRRAHAVHADSEIARAVLVAGLLHESGFEVEVHGGQW